MFYLVIIVKTKTPSKFCVLPTRLLGCERNLPVGGETEHCGREASFLLTGEKTVNCATEPLVLNIFLSNGVFCLHPIHLMSFIKKIQLLADRYH